MPKKYMNDFQRVKAGNWIEEKKAWIVTASSPEVIARKAMGELGHRVTSSFVKSYLTETDWFEKAKKEANAEPASLEDLHHAMRLTLDALMQVIDGEPICSREIESTIRTAKALVASSESSSTLYEVGQLDLDIGRRVTEEQMKAGHA